MNGLMTAEELADALAVSPATIMGWARKGVIPAVRISDRTIRFDWHTVLRELAKRQTGVTPIVRALHEFTSRPAHEHREEV